jgi:hypothetical protein
LHADLDHLARLDPRTYDLSPEPPWSGWAVEESSRRLSRIATIIAISSFGLRAAAVALAILLR